ncbi:MAG: tRNA threonylcarbamoyladenosine dehydratase [Planctomycetia bacterium]|nr:tRNA threonylcarbamoyladenosine dehydratase [Planctomycetia bacterium]
MSDDRFARTQLFLGNEKFEKLRKARVLVVGLGAVGSYAVEGLARAGIGHLRLVDFDTVQATNINRQLYALDSTLGQLKCDVAAARVRDIHPDCDVQPRNLFVDADTMNALFDGFSPDFAIDAIDALNPKIELMKTLRDRGIPALSSMGAALRTDPSQIVLGKLEDVKGDPLAKMLRKFMRRRGISLDFTCVYSTENIADVRHRCLGEEEKADPTRRGRPRHTLGSLPTLTGIFGLTIANYAIQWLVEGSWSSLEKRPKRLKPRRHQTAKKA